MRAKAIITGLAVCGALLWPAGCGSVPGLTGGKIGADEDTLLDLMDQAEDIVLPDFPLAVLIELVGGPSVGVAYEAEDVDRWQFRFVDDIYATFPGTVELDFAEGGFDVPVLVPWPLLGTVFESLPREMDLVEAVGLLRDAGYDEPFSSVVFRRPLTNPLPDEAMFIFTLPGKYVSVGAISGQVNEETM
jgi:hypothetical protein